MEAWKPDPDPDSVVDQLVKKYDETSMQLPDLESEPHLLISKVRKHYMEYVIKLLALNYENNQKLVNKNIYLPSAIWRCAKNIETSAVQACMVVQLYRKNIQTVIKELKNDTKKGKLNKKLYDCLHRPPENEKKIQTDFSTPNNCSCQCKCNDRKKRRRISNTSGGMNESLLNDLSHSSNHSTSITSQPMPLTSTNIFDNLLQGPVPTISDVQMVPNQSLSYVSPPKPAMPVEAPYSDELAEQLEKLFHSDPNDDDLFEGTLCSNEYVFNDGTKKNSGENSIGLPIPQTHVTNNTVIEAHEAKIKSLDERVASLAGLLANSNDNPAPQPINDIQTNIQRPKRHNSSKWLCEEYFLKVRLYELLDLIRETNRMGHMRIKDLFRDLFGDDSDDEGMLSPLEETPEFVISCKERIAPWVVKLLTPYYIKGRIRGKSLFKALAKHLIRLIYQCSRYPNEYEVSSFVSDFLENHKMIRCEADFKKFRIDNL